jgi:hypothetical protein
MKLAFRLRTVSAALALLIAVALAAPLAGVHPAPARSQEESAWQPISLIYLSDVKGKIEPCG